MSYTTKFAVALLMTHVSVRAAISTDGLWTGKDWEQSDVGYRYTNGVPNSADYETNRRIKAPIALPENQMTDWETKENVERVKDLVTTDDWAFWFSLADTEAGLTR